MSAPPWRGKPGENVCCACAYVSIPVSRIRIAGYAQADAIQLCGREGLSMCGGWTTHNDSSSLRNPPPPASTPTGGPDLLQPGPLPHILRLPSTHHLRQAQRSSWASPLSCSTCSVHLHDYLHPASLPLTRLTSHLSPAGSVIMDSPLTHPQARDPLCICICVHYRG